jgi:drug/metabolite transporter (DMT)-like permease
MFHDKRMHGVALVSLGIIFYSADALLIRMSNTEGFTAAFWRGLFTAVTFGVFFCIKYPRNKKDILIQGGIPLLISGFLWSLSGVGFTLAVRMTNTSVTLVCLSMAPLAAAISSFLFFKERLSLVTICCTVISILGIGYIYKDGNRTGTLPGNIFAILTPVILGANFANLHHHPSMSRVAVCLFGGILGAIISLVAVKGAVLIPFSSIRYLMLLGILILPMGQILVTTGTKFISASEASLINSFETVLGIVYIWLFLNERPSQNCLIGGIVVALAIIFNTMVKLRRN